MGRADEGEATAAEGAAVRPQSQGCSRLTAAPSQGPQGGAGHRHLQGTDKHKALSWASSQGITPRPHPAAHLLCFQA